MLSGLTLNQPKLNNTVYNPERAASGFSALWGYFSARVGVLWGDFLVLWGWKFFPIDVATLKKRVCGGVGRVGVKIEIYIGRNIYNEKI